MSSATPLPNRGRQLVLTHNKADGSLEQVRREGEQRLSELEYAPDELLYEREEGLEDGEHGVQQGRANGSE